MKIDQMEAFLVRLPLQKPFGIANTVIDYCDTVYVRLESGGVSGWGEVTPGNRPYVTSAWSGGVFRTIREHLFPLLRSVSAVESGERLAELLAPVKGNRHAKGALDMAWHDLDARLGGEPLWKRFGGEKRSMEVGLTFDRYDDRDAFFADLDRARDDGFHRISLKIRPGWEIQAVRAARDACPWPMLLQVDVEGALEHDSQTELFYRLQDYMPTLIEQPFNQADYVGLAMLQESLRTPICLDESVKTRAQAEIAVDLASGGYFCLKPGRVGGLTEGKAIAALAREREIGCYGGMDLTSSVGYRHLLALASLPGFKLPCDYIRFEEVFTEDPGLPIVPTRPNLPNEENENGTKKNSFLAVELWDEPGIGFEPNREIIERCMVESC